MNFIQAFLTYKELIKTGEIQSTAEGEHIFIDVRGNVTGDILVFICPKNKVASPGVDIIELINSDNKLEQQQQVAFKSLQEKFDGLTSLPERLVRLIIFGMSLLYVWWKSDTLYALFTGRVHLVEILSLLPLIVVLVITPILGKIFGFSLLKPALTIFIWAIRLIRKIRNRLVKESQG